MRRFDSTKRLADSNHIRNHNPRMLCGVWYITMITIKATKNELIEQINSFIWAYKVGDNIIYNLGVIFNLVEDNSAQKNYNKPISILCVSVVEAVLADFMERLLRGTNQFPKKLADKKVLIKERLRRETKLHQAIFLDEVYQYTRLKNFGFEDLIAISEEFQIMGKDDEIYRKLKLMGRYRNRVHILNYFGNFERNESTAFNSRRTQEVVDYMQSILSYMASNYPRP